MKWYDEDLNAIFAALAQSSTLIEACKRYESATGKHLDGSSVTHAFRDRGWQPAGYYVGDPARIAQVWHGSASISDAHLRPGGSLGHPDSMGDAGERVRVGDRPQSQDGGQRQLREPADPAGWEAFAKASGIGSVAQTPPVDPRVKAGDSDKPDYVDDVPSLADLGATERTRRLNVDARRDLRRTLERIDDLESTIRAYERYTSEPIRPVKTATMRPGKRPAAAVALLSDIHAEEGVTRTEAINNEYTLTIARQRVARFFAGVIWLIDQATAFDVDTLVLWLGGDLISGDIHDELLERCEVPPAEATLLVRDWLVAGLRSVLAARPEMRIVVPCSCGNHSRTTKKMNAATGYGHSWEWLLYQVLGHDFKDEPRIQFHATRDEMQYAEVHGFKLAFHHGHRMKYNGGIGGITIPAIKAMHRWDQWRECDLYHFGHFHTRIDLGKVCFNGSVIGPSPYGFAIGAEPEPPQQSFYILDAKRGKTMSSPVWVAA